MWSDGVTSNPRTFTATSSPVTFTADYNCTGSLTATINVNSVNQVGQPITGYAVTLVNSGGATVASGVTATTFTVAIGLTYSLETTGSGSCTFSNWLTASTNAPISFQATNGGQVFTAVFDCNSNGGPTTITVYAHRVPAGYWADCFATVCAQGTGPGATMFFALYTAGGTLVTTGFANEDGYTFTGLTAGATYLVRAENCDACHGSTHDVLFDHWGETNTTDPLPLVAGSSIDAWYICTNGCGGT
jgi:hypothetical protein